VTFSESEIVSDTRPVRQGDIIRRIQPVDAWDDVAIVVTADCDIARDKHAGRLTCVPLVPAEAYLSAYFLPKRMRRLEISLSDKLLPLMRKYQLASGPPSATPIKTVRAHRWLLDNEPSYIADRLSIPEDQRGRFISLANAFKRLGSAIEQSLDGQISAICEAEQALGRGDEPVLRAKLGKEIANHIRDLPGDALFIRSLCADGSDGYVAYLRAIMEIRDENVATKISQRSFNISHERYARLTPPYVYALTQRLGSVFSSIGLPDEYETSRDEFAANIVKSEPNGVQQ
jgi:hypothetical protein